MGEFSCTDSDGGKIYNVLGECKLMSESSGARAQSDRCTGSNTLEECYCTYSGDTVRLETKEYACIDECVDGVCTNVAECITNSDCGVDGYVGEAYCEDDSLKQTYRQYTCNNPGTSEADCSYSEYERVKDGCGGDWCTEWGSNYCKDGDVYHSRTCHNTGCSDAECFDNSNLEEELVEECDNGCTDGVCNL